MQGKDKGESSEGEPRSDAWWAELARRLLHERQQEVIKTLERSGSPLSIRELGEVMESIEPVHLDYHVGRLRRLDALEFADSPYTSQKSSMDVRYRLTPEKILGDGR